MSEPTDAQVEAEEDKRLDQQIDEQYDRAEPPEVPGLVRLAMMLRTEADTPTYQELVGEDLEIKDLARLWLTAVEHQRAAKNVVAAIADELGDRLADRDRPVEVYDQVVFFKTKKTKRIDDTEGFWEWMKANPALLEVAFNPNAARKTGMPSSVFDTFYKEEESEYPVVSAIPINVIEANKQRKERT